MLKAAATRNVHDPFATQALHEFAAGALIPDILQHSPRWLADEREELALQAALRRACDAREFADGPTVTEYPLACIASSARRTVRGIGDTAPPCFEMSLDPLISHLYRSARKSSVSG